MQEQRQWCDSEVLQIILSKTHERLALVQLDSLVAWNWKQGETWQQLPSSCQQRRMVLANEPFSYNHNAKSLSVKRLIDHTSGSCFSCSSWILAQCHLWLLDFADNNDHRTRSRSVCGTACYLHWLALAAKAKGFGGYVINYDSSVCWIRWACKLVNASLLISRSWKWNQD